MTEGAMKGAYHPRRDDDVAVWLKRMRDRHAQRLPEFVVIDLLLDRYRECADYGLTLHVEDDDAGDP